MEEENLYDEFGNYIGPELDEDVKLCYFFKKIKKYFKNI